MQSNAKRGTQPFDICFGHTVRIRWAVNDVQSEVQLIKMKNRATAYTCNGPSPLFFDPEGRGDLLVPTCYAMWRCPHILDRLYTYSEVSPKVCQSEVHTPLQFRHSTFASLGFSPSSCPSLGNLRGRALLAKEVLVQTRGSHKLATRAERPHAVYRFLGEPIFSCRASLPLTGVWGILTQRTCALSASRRTLTPLLLEQWRSAATMWQRLGEPTQCPPCYAFPVCTVTVFAIPQAMPQVKLSDHCGTVKVRRFWRRFEGPAFT